MSRRVRRLRSDALMRFSGDLDLFSDKVAFFLVERGDLLSSDWEPYAFETRA